MIYGSDVSSRPLDSLSLGEPAYIYVGGCPLDVVKYGTKRVCEVWRNRAARSGHHVLESTLQTIELFRGEIYDRLRAMCCLGCDIFGRQDVLYCWMFHFRLCVGVRWW